MIIKITDILYGPDGKRFTFTGGLKRLNFTGKDITTLRAGGHDFYIYQLPVGYDPLLHKLNGVIAPTPDTTYCSEGFTDLTAEQLEENLALKVISDRAAFVASRTVIVQAIKVTTVAGNTFDGCEVSRGRMGDAVTGLDDVQTIRWVLADGSNIMATRAELKEALYLIGREEEAVWVESS